MSTTKKAAVVKFPSWIEISSFALKQNLKTLRNIIASNTVLAPCIKANAYGHGIIETAKIISAAGADWLSVNSVSEAKKLRQAGIKTQLYILGYVLREELNEIFKLNCRIVVYNKETLLQLSKHSADYNKKAFVHIKIETGNNRQGIALHEAARFIDFARSLPGIEVEGLSTHFANIEDIKHEDMFASMKKETHKYSKKLYPRYQLDNFQKLISEIEELGIDIKYKHCSNSAATLLYSNTHFNLVRPGIAIYGLWPSNEVKIAAEKIHPGIKLHPMLTWKTIIAQIKEVPAHSYIGYGCTFKTKRKSKIAILPVGYYDGYDRKLSNKAFVIINDRRAPVLGRVCMNMIVVDVTDIPGLSIENEAILLGKSKSHEISADQLGYFAGTINYEITTRIREDIPRIVVD